jgi:hypothetical protein
VTRFPHPSDCRDDALLTGADAMNIGIFSDPLTFDIRVPENQQRLFSDTDFIPTEEYHCTWDGDTLLVTWEQRLTDEIPRAGGHVVIDVVRDVARRMGDDIYVQACTPDCDYSFIHQTSRVTADPALEQFEWAQNPVNPYRFEVVAPIAWDASEVAQQFYDEIYLRSHYFGEMKNSGRRLLDIDHKAKHDREDLLKVNYARSAADSLPLKERLRSRWHLRRWRRDTSVLINRLWVELALLEHQKAEWRDLEFHYKDIIGDDLALFEHDNEQESIAIEALNPETTVKAVQFAAARLDANALVRATALGALGGAITGAGAAGLIQLLAG